MANGWKAIEGERQQRQDMADKTQESLHHILEAAAAAATTKLPWNHHLRSSWLLQIPPSKLQPRTPYPKPQTINYVLNGSKIPTSETFTKIVVSDTTFSSSSNILRVQTASDKNVKDTANHPVESFKDHTPKNNLLRTY